MKLGRILILFTIMLFSGILVSCSSDDDEKVKSEGTLSFGETNTKITKVILYYEGDKLESSKYFTLQMIGEGLTLTGNDIKGSGISLTAHLHTPTNGFSFAKYVYGSFEDITKNTVTNIELSSFTNGEGGSLAGFENSNNEVTINKSEGIYEITIKGLAPRYGEETPQKLSIYYKGEIAILKSLGKG